MHARAPTSLYFQKKLKYNQQDDEETDEETDEDDGDIDFNTLNDLEVIEFDS